MFGCRPQAAVLPRRCRFVAALPFGPVSWVRPPAPTDRPLATALSFIFPQKRRGGRETQGAGRGIRCLLLSIQPIFPRGVLHCYTPGHCYGNVRIGGHYPQGHFGVVCDRSGVCRVSHPRLSVSPCGGLARVRPDGWWVLVRRWVGLA